MIKCSAGTAKVLGLKELKSDALPTTAYLMTGERCSNDCSFCPQAKYSGARADLLSRVTWPEYAREAVLDGVARAFEANSIKRSCFQVTNSKHALQETKVFLQDLQSKSPVPICVSCSVGTVQAVSELINQGADHVSIALDAACERIFVENKAGSWSQKYRLLQESAKEFPGRIATHLIVGLGETEEEMLRTVQEMVDLGVTIALFALTPIKGTRLEHGKPPAIDQYRRIQAARYLIQKGLDRFEKMCFEGGKLVRLGLSEEEWVNALADGEAFRTSGCPDCNRPYYNEKPGGLIYNYPKPLTLEQREQALRELNLGGLTGSVQIPD